MDDARRALEEGLALADKNDEQQDAELHRLKGELLLAESSDQAAAALDCFHQAIDTARRRQSKAWELRATLSRAGSGCGKAARTGGTLAAIYGTFTEGVHDAGPRGGPEVLFDRVTYRVAFGSFSANQKFRAPEWKSMTSGKWSEARLVSGLWTTRAWRTSIGPRVKALSREMTG